MLVGEQPVAEWIDRVRAEYLEMPGLSVTKRQMCRLWLFEASVCNGGVDSPIASNCLRGRPDNT